MLNTDTYNTIESPVQSEYKISGSHFIALAFPIQTVIEAKQQIAIIKKQFATANHCCFAYVLGFNNEIQITNDDSEPSNTAGKPILRAILNHKLTNTLVIVIRYFGGKLLGTRGLIDSYGGVSSMALNAAVVVNKIIVQKYQLVCDIEYENEVFRIVKQFGLRVISHQYNEKITIIFEVRRQHVDSVLKQVESKHYFNTTYIA